MYRFFVLVFALLVVTPKVYAQTNPCKQHHCMAVIDAGSTGSRLHFFAYDLDSSNSAININELWSKKIKPGFATIEANQNTVDAYLTTLFSGAPSYQQIPTYFYATAGMRLLPASKQKMFYQALRRWFAQQTDWQLLDAKTITGNQEALFDWLSVNYHLGTLKAVQTQSVGVMDMGGASVQIVFPVNNSNALKGKTIAEFDLYGQHIALSVHSFLGLGQTEMSHQFLNSASCFSNNYPLPDGEYGLGNAYTCQQEISSLMNAVHNVDTEIKPLIAANPVDTWYSIGGLSNLVGNDSVFDFSNSQITNKTLLQQAESAVCNQTWDNLNAKFPNDDYIYQYCLLSSYYYALMVDGYGLSPEETVNYIANDKVDWTIGVVLQH